MGTKFLSEKNEVDLEVALSAVAAFPTLERASEYMKDYGITVSPAKLKTMANIHKDEFEKVREQLAPKVEKMVANDMLDNANLATSIEAMALQRTQEKLEEHKVHEPWKVARDLADLKAKSIDKRLALQGRPTHITETRSAEEIVRALEGMGVAKRVEITQGDVSE